MKTLISCILTLALTSSVSDKIRTIEYQGDKVKTTYDVPRKFIGTYAGNKDGYLKLNADGTGEYNYDVFGFAPKDCKKNVIPIEWGILIDDNNKRVQLSREYGVSHPLLMKSIGNIQFQGCREPVMLDFIMEYKDGSLGISSSDDWVKN